MHKCEVMGVAHAHTCALYCDSLSIVCKYNVLGEGRCSMSLGSRSSGP